jgi:hypothetical protein
MMTRRRPRRSDSAPYFPVVNADIIPLHKLTASAKFDARADIYSYFLRSMSKCLGNMTVWIWLPDFNDRVLASR